MISVKDLVKQRLQHFVLLPIHFVMLSRQTSPCRRKIETSSGKISMLYPALCGNMRTENYGSKCS